MELREQAFRDLEAEREHLLAIMESNLSSDMAMAIEVVNLVRTSIECPEQPAIHVSNKGAIDANA